MASIAQRVLGAPPLRPQRRVVVTGLGLVTPLATGAARTWARLANGEGGIVSLTAPEYAQLPSRVAGVVRRGQGDGEFDAERYVGKANARSAGIDFIAFGMGAAEEAMHDSGLAAALAKKRMPYSLDRCGIALGSGIGGLSDIASAAELMAKDPIGGHRKISPFFVPRILANMAAGNVSIRWGLKGPVHAASTACATGAHAIGDAFRFIKYGHADVMLAGGTEASIHPLALAGFSRAKALSTARNDSPSSSSRPFDASRDGFVLGEGAGVLVLEEMEAAMRRGARIYAEVRGYGASGDAHHITSPAEDGDGPLHCMAAALEEGGLTAADIAYVNAHATSTPLGDSIEAKAIDRVLKITSSSQDARGDVDSKPLVSSTKGAIGHLLGAAGAVEAALSILALQHGVAPPNLNLETPEYQPTSFEYSTRSSPPLCPSRPAVLSNSFGFGGTYCSLAFSLIPESPGKYNHIY